MRVGQPAADAVTSGTPVRESTDWRNHMSSERSRRRWRGLLVLTVLLALVAAACGSDDKSEGGSSDTTKAPSGATTKVSAPGVTDTEIRFASFGTNSNNPLGTCVLKCYDEGVKAYFAYVNSKGGVFGRKLVLTDELDDELTKNKEKALELVSKNDAFGIFSATQFPSGYEDIIKAKIPFYVWMIHPAQSSAENVFGNAAPPCIDCTTQTVPYIAKLSKAKKVAALGYGISPNSQICANGIKKSVEKYSDGIGGAHVVYVNDHLEFGLKNGVGPEVSAMKKAGVDLVAACLDLNGMKTIAQEMERQGMGDVPMQHPNTYDAEFVKAAGDLFEGDYVSVGFRPFEANAGKSALDTYKTWMDKSGADRISEISMDGWINATTAVESIKRAGENFDRAKVIEPTGRAMGRDVVYSMPAFANRRMYVRGRIRLYLYL